ncbi:MAG: AraC family transcriptional regulator ligand-binding domain-containing protein [Nevskia sp.]|nr:AraC family transcriptional regulator ligand-binding domain-containing protein [Nevskia sp.]
MAQALRYIQNANRLAPRPDWYHEWARDLADHFHGPLSMALLSAPTLGAALEAFFKYFPARIPYLHPRGRRRGARYYAELCPLIDLGSSKPLLIEVPLLILQQYLASVYSVDLAQAAVELDYPPTPHADAYSRAFRCPVRFGAAGNALVIPAQWLDVANVGYAESSWSFALQQCEASLGAAGGRSTLARVRACLAAALTEPDRVRAMPRLEEVAGQLCMSPRTVIRHLRAEGTTYQETVDELLKGRARELLANRALKIKEVSAALGFHDPANFGTAFKRWFALSPRAWRNRAAARAPRG